MQYTHVYATRIMPNELSYIIKIFVLILYFKSLSSQIFFFATISFLLCHIVCYLQYFERSRFLFIYFFRYFHRIIFFLHYEYYDFFLSEFLFISDNINCSTKLKEKKRKGSLTLSTF